MKKVKRVRRGLSLLFVVLLILSLLPAGVLAVSSSTQVGWKQYYGHNSNNTMVSTADSAKGHFKIYIGKYGKYVMGIYFTYKVRYAMIPFENT